MNIPTGIDEIDNLLSGGLKKNSITHIYGESGSGKTTFCLQVAAKIANKKTVIYIATPRFSAERFKQIINEKNPKKIASNVIVFQTNSLTKHESAVKNIKNITEKHDIGLVILDSPAYIGFNDKQNNFDMIDQILYLLSIAKKQEFPILLSNQVYTDINKNKLIPVGGKLIKDISYDTIKIEKMKSNMRKFILEKKDNKKSCKTLIIKKRGFE
ncbi:RecA/RadA recombinase [Methanonatronarchaeum thermophilum]|uniref:DNA repair and recombination protein RadB n=1 Tax=Methanonatronarchaeum thermophilum TaxID=1927129 RepID=A0A1Y3GD00_9EURY|nr:ATPase domain-containing protein [Methanonatronarchaeum thermophilum]OUJ18074.1 RecA/RadA recombinase [Methanonatronarchaeum thermophilum]